MTLTPIPCFADLVSKAERVKVLSCSSAPLSPLPPLLQHSQPIIVVAPMEGTLLPLPTSEVVLILTKTTLLIENEPTQVRVVDHLTAKYAAKRAIMLTLQPTVCSI